MDFGVIIACYRRDYHYARGTVASVRRYMPDVPILLIIDGDFPVDDLKRAYGVQTLYRADVKDEFLRTRSFGWGHTKNISIWLSPFERYLLMDADTVLLGDVRKKFPPLDEWDVLLDRQRIPHTDPEVDKWFFEHDLLESHFPQFPWRKYSSQYTCPGVWAGRRELFPLEEYKAVMELALREPRLFKFGDMGLLNFMIFRGVEEGRLKLKTADIQIIVADYAKDELERRFSIGNPEPVKEPADPVILHYPHPKPTLDLGSVAAPMSYFRREAMTLNGKSPLRIEAQLHLEDFLYIHWPRQKATARRRTQKIKSILLGRNGKAANG